MQIFVAYYTFIGSGGGIFRIPFFSIDSSIVAFPFYVMGYLVKKGKYINKCEKKLTLTICSVIAWLYLYFVGLHNGKIDIDGMQLGNNILAFYLNGLIGSFAVISTVKAIEVKSSFICEIGSSTLTILGTHTYFNKLGTLVVVVLLGISPSNIPVVYVIIISIVAVVFGVYINRFLLKNMPIFVGKKRCLN